MFDLARFLRLAAATWAEQRKSWAWFLAAGIMLHFVLVLLLFAGHRGYDVFTTGGQAALFVAGLFLTAPIFAARYFQGLARPESALVVLMRPASIFEKWLLAVLVVAVAYPLAYHLAFYVCDIPAWFIARGQADAEFAAAAKENEQALLRLSGWRDVEQRQFFHAFQGPRIVAPIALMLTALQAFAVVGSLLFRATPALKTLLVCFLLLLVTILVAIVFDADPAPFFVPWDPESAPLRPVDVAYLAVWFAVPTLLWTAAWLALREREVA